VERGGGSGDREARAAELGHGRATLHIEQGSGGRRHLGRRAQSQAAQQNLIQFQMESNYIQILSSFDQSKNDFPELKKFEIKYGH
jgi:hypothetical protein